LPPSFWLPAAFRPLLASSASSSSVGEARSSSRSVAAARMLDIGLLAPLSSIT
jgi:hypothetical protein